MSPRTIGIVFGVAFSTAVAADETETRIAFLDQVRMNFARWDPNGNGLLEAAEVDKAIALPEFHGDSAAALVALKRGRKTPTETFTLKGVTAGAEQATESANSSERLESLFVWARQRISGANRQLFATQSPRIDSIRQGKLGDCFCLAALRSLLQRDPGAIARMIDPLPDGKYRVKLGEKEIVVSPLTDGELALGASANDGLWPLIYEKAVGLSRMKEDAPDATPLNTVTRGGSAGSMMSALTQHPIKRWSCKTWRDAAEEQRATLLNDLRTQLRSAEAERRLITGGTAALAKGGKGIPGILFNHGYSVLHYDESSDTIRLWNPHGDAFQPKGEPGLEHGYPMERGEFTLPLTELVQFFGGFAFEQTPPQS